MGPGDLWRPIEGSFEILYNYELLPLADEIVLCSDVTSPFSSNLAVAGAAGAKNSAKTAENCLI